MMAQGTHDFVPDPRNDAILINVNGALVPRAEASVSVFDSGFMLGDGVWEGIRVHRGRMAFLDQHLDRLWEGAKAIAMDIGISREALERRLYDTIDANRMDACHIRLMVTRGIRSTPYQDPRVIVSPATIVIIAEHKDPLPATVEKGLSLFTVHVRRGDPAVQDPKLNSHSKLNCITACIQAAQAGGGQALGQAGHGIATGAAADLVSLTAADPALAGRRGDAILDSWIFGRGGRLVDCVWHRGVQCVAGGRHVARAAIDARYRDAMQALLA